MFPHGVGATVTENAWALSASLLAGNGLAALGGEYSLVKAVAITTIIQVAIALCRGWFTERRDLLHTLRDLLREQRETYLTFIEKEKEERHRVANQAHYAELKLALVKEGVPLSQIPEKMPAIYPEVPKA